MAFPSNCDCIFTPFQKRRHSHCLSTPTLQKKENRLKAQGGFSILGKAQKHNNPSSRKAHLSSAAETQGEVLFSLQKFPLVRTSEEKRWTNSQAEGESTRESQKLGTEILLVLMSFHESQVLFSTLRRRPPGQDFRREQTFF